MFQIAQYRPGCRTTTQNFSIHLPNEKMTKQNRMLMMVNNRVKVTQNDGRIILGQLLAFDKYMNLVVADCEEYRKIKGKMATDNGQRSSLRRSLGLVVLRGETIVSCSLETGAPLSGFENKARVPAAQQMAPGMRPMMPGGMGVPAPMPAAMMMRPGMAPPPMMMPPGMMRQ